LIILVNLDFRIMLSSLFDPKFKNLTWLPKEEIKIRQKLIDNSSLLRLNDPQRKKRKQ